MDPNNQPQPTSPSENPTPEPQVPSPTTPSPEVPSPEPAVPVQPPVAQPNMQENMQSGEAAVPPTDASTAPSGENPGQILGIVGIISAFFIAPVAIVLGILSRNKSKQAGHPTTLGTTALILGIVFTVLGILVAILWTVIIAAAFSAAP